MSYRDQPDEPSPLNIRFRNIEEAEYWLERHPQESEEPTERTLELSDEAD